MGGPNEVQLSYCIGCPISSNCILSRAIYCTNDEGRIATLLIVYLLFLSANHFLQKCGTALMKICRSLYIPWVISKQIKVKFVKLKQLFFLVIAQLRHVEINPIIGGYLALALAIHLGQVRQQGCQILLHSYVHHIIRKILKSPNYIIFDMTVKAIAMVRPDDIGSHYMHYMWR